MSEASVEQTLGQILGELKGIDYRLQRADDSRAVVHRRLDEVSERTVHLENEVHSMRREMEGMQAVTDDVTKLRERAVGAGTLGRGLLILGGWIVGAASGAGVVYPWITGRPPP